MQKKTGRSAGASAKKETATSRLGRKVKRAATRAKEALAPYVSTARKPAARKSSRASSASRATRGSKSSRSR
jgi:hypothetical protein